MSQTAKSDNINAHLLAGALSGLVNCVCLQPLDVLKTRLQQQLYHQLNTGSITSGLSAIGRQIVHMEGPLGLWRVSFLDFVAIACVQTCIKQGTLPTIIRNTPGSAMYFAVLNSTQRLLASASGILHPNSDDRNNRVASKLPPHLNLLAGGISRVSVGLLMMPISVVKVRYESDLYHYRGIGDALRSIVRTDGFRGLFAGFGSTMMRDAPFAGLYVVFYEHAKGILRDNGALSVMINTLSAVVSGFLATAITHPFDVIRTRIQLKPEQYRNMWWASRKLLTETGGRAFMAGLSPRLIRKTLSAAITWTIYEESVKVFSANDYRT